MPSGRTSRPALQATDLLATLPACSGRRQNHPCRRYHERKLGDQTRDDDDKEPHEERSCGRSQTSLYNGTRTHLSLNKDAPISRAVETAGRILGCPILGGLHHQYTRIRFTVGTAANDVAPIVQFAIDRPGRPDPVRRKSTPIPDSQRHAWDDRAHRNRSRRTRSGSST